MFSVGSGFVCGNLRNAEVLVCIASESCDIIDVMGVLQSVIMTPT